MLIDLDGMTFAGAAASVLVDRPPPPAVSPGYGTFLQIGPPLANPIAIAGMPGVEVWTTNSPVFTYYAPHDGTLRVPLWPTGLPSGSWTFALQFFAAYPGSFPFAATPALVITY